MKKMFERLRELLLHIWAWILWKRCGMVFTNDATVCIDEEPYNTAREKWHKAFDQWQKALTAAHDATLKRKGRHCLCQRVPHIRASAKQDKARQNP